MKVKYRIYPDRHGFWNVDWEFTPLQRQASLQLFTSKPRTFVALLPWRQKRGKAILERRCKAYADKVCKRAEELQTDQELRTAAPYVEYNCDD